jgi:hypothetical protein
MIPKSTAYCLISTTGIVLARGSARDMRKLANKHHGCRVGLGFGPVGSSTIEPARSTATADGFTATVTKLTAAEK